MTAYLDNASTTRVRPEVLEAAASCGRDAFGNPSSFHAVGRRARRVVEDARELIADRLSVKPRQVLFTSGATEANNLALSGSSPRRLVTTAIEHESVLHTARRLARKGADVDFLPVDWAGRVATADLQKALERPAELISVMLVNNETGTVQPVADLANIARARGSSVHCDAVQALGKIPWDAAALGVDFVSISSHKIHGPKGVGALVARDPEKLHPILFGGAQEFEKRAGTENVAGIAGFAVAVDLALRELPTQQNQIARRRDRLEAGLQEKISGVRVNGDRAGRAPHISNVRFEGVDGEALMMALDARGIWVSAGSACAALGTEPSHVLIAIGLDPAAVKGSIRLSLASDTTDREIDEALSVIPEVVAKLRETR